VESSNPLTGTVKPSAVNKCRALLVLSGFARQRTKAVIMANNELVKDAALPSTRASNRTDAPDSISGGNALSRAPVGILIRLAVLSAAAAVAFFLWEGHTGLNLPDGGFFWYGVQRVLHGEVPIRDFQAYEPGRYYWSAAFLAGTAGTSIVALRATVQVFSWMGILASLWLIYRRTEKRDTLLWLIAAVTVGFWMTPWFKVFDNTIAMLVACALSYLLRRPSPPRYLVMGLCVGFAAVFGKNHCAYALVACVGAVAYLALCMRRLCTPVELGSGLLGVVAGASPLLAMLLIPRFATAFLDTIRLVLRAGATNFSLPIPYPWQVSLEQLSLFDFASAVLLGTLFLWIVAFPLLGLACLAWKQQRKALCSRPEFVAALLVSVSYAHYAFSRADVTHLAVSVTPVIVACFVGISALNPWLRYALAALLCGASVIVAGPSHPGWECLETRCTVTTVGEDKLLVRPSTANDVALLNRLIRDFAPHGRSYYVTPYWPGSYALFDAKSPTWATYALWSQSSSAQQQEIDRIKAAAPGFVLINDLPLDGREGQRFSQTNPLTYTYVKTHFNLVQGYGLPDGYELYTPR
jgi:hypothetical protein